jgi:hypothetical protein
MLYQARARSTLNPSKQKGTAHETAVVNWLRNQNSGWDVERVTLSGNKDKGDIRIKDGEGGEWGIEAKNCSAMSLAAWVKEADIESDNAGRPVVVVAKRKGTTDVGQYYVITTLNMFMSFL